MSDILVLGLVASVAIISWLLYKLWRLRSQIDQEAMSQFQAWRANDYEATKREQAELATREAQLQLELWKTSAESTIRADAIQKSQSVIIGKVTEHVVPYLPDFAFNPKDARFIGSPVDLIVFDGLDRDALEQIVFIEVKSSASASLTRRERHIRDAISAGRVRWQEIRLDPSRVTKMGAAPESVWWKAGP
jgi:predicted Holliday junction resolvase-like endonuclease